MWQMAVDYYSACVRFGRAHAAAVLERVPLTDERKAHKVLALAKRHGLGAVARSVAAVMGMRLFRGGNYASSIVWFVEARDANRLSLVSFNFDCVQLIVWGKIQGGSGRPPPLLPWFLLMMVVIHSLT